MPTWSNRISLQGPIGPASIVTVQAPPGPNVGVVGGYAVWNTGTEVRLYGPKLSNGWEGGVDPVFARLTGPNGSNGARGSIIYAGSGPFDATKFPDAKAGLDYYFQTDTTTLYPLISG